MALSRLAREFATEIKQQDWSDSPYRRDRAGHDRSTDSNYGEETLSQRETDSIRTNVMWVTAQVLGHADPNFDVYEYAEACGVDTQNSRGGKDGGIESGLRKHNSLYLCPGTWEDSEEQLC
ncbi:hypothetical protein AB0K21_35375 [Streptosporangium sp. NPDC049248]|uniref:hypothetical protein n=1 Tax=Streptosporangium sp. NPDC049248 TaxID=3155651 RepID=UPI00341F2C85